MTYDEICVRASDFEMQAEVIIAHVGLGDHRRLAEAANYITCANFLRQKASAMKAK